jgi:catechol 2,3-dioxygenase-like lactoylglutathione lyase family enzyme
MARTAFIDHIGIGVPDLAAAKAWYDELMPILGLTKWFPTSPSGEYN